MGSLNRRILAQPPSRGAGLTLIELLVALVVAAALVGVVSVSGSGRPERALRSEAERLALTLTLAREVAQVRSRAIRLVTEAQGYRFEIFQERAWRALDDDRDLRPRAWSVHTRMHIERPDGLGQIEFGRDQIDPPFRVRLSRAGMTVVVDANGLGDFTVRE